MTNIIDSQDAEQDIAEILLSIEKELRMMNIKLTHMSDIEVTREDIE